MRSFLYFLFLNLTGRQVAGRFDLIGVDISKIRACRCGFPHLWVEHHLEPIDHIVGCDAAPSINPVAIGWEFDILQAGTVFLSAAAVRRPTAKQLLPSVSQGTSSSRSSAGCARTRPS